MPFAVSPARIAAGRGVYCSRKCHIAATARQKRMCEHCGKEFMPRNLRIRFCCAKCAREASVGVDTKYKVPNVPYSVVQDGYVAFAGAFGRDIHGTPINGLDPQYCPLG